MGFDPYATWLGIPPDRRPPTYYDLLGLAPDESDPEMIEQAALRRMSKVRQHQLGPHSELSQEVLAELARARLILMDPDRRDDYDAKLKARAETHRNPSADSEELLNADSPRRHAGLDEGAPEVLASLALTELPGDDRFSLRPASKKGLSGWKKGLLAGAILASHAAILGTFVYFMFGPRIVNQEAPRVVWRIPGVPAPEPKPIPPAPLAPKAVDARKGKTGHGRTRTSDVPAATPTIPARQQAGTSGGTAAEDPEPPDQSAGVDLTAPKPAALAMPTMERSPPRKKPVRALKPADLKRLKAARSDLTKAQDRHDDAMKKAYGGLLRAFDVRIRQIRSNRDIKPPDRAVWLDELSQEKTNFENRHVLPRSRWMTGPVIEYQLMVYDARRRLSAAYSALIKLCELTDLDEALSLTRELKNVEGESGEADLLVNGSFWDGLRCMLPGGAAIPFSLRVVERQGRHFTGDVTDNNGAAIARVKGEFDGFKIRWSTQLMLRDPNKAWNIAGVICGDSLLANFEGVDTNAQNEPVHLEGSIQLELKR